MKPRRNSTDEPYYISKLIGDEPRYFTVNVMPVGFGNEFTRQFKSQLNAEIYITVIDNKTQYNVTEYNFIRKFSPEEVETECLRQERLGKEALRLESQAKIRTLENSRNPTSFPCEICGEKHWNSRCCQKCDYDMHTCHFCGDSLGHTEVSVCYILEGLGE